MFQGSPQSRHPSPGVQPAGIVCGLRGKSATANSPCQLVDKPDRLRADVFQVFWWAFLRLP